MKKLSSNIKNNQTTKMSQYYSKEDEIFFNSLGKPKTPPPPIQPLETRFEQYDLLEEKLEQFDIKGTVVAMHAGPVVTLFEYQPDIRVKVSRILSLEDDLAMALRALSIRIIAPIPGRSVVGFEVANRDRQDV